MESFRKLGLSDTTIEAIEAKGYTEPTEIQAKTIPLLLTGEKDIVGQSQTGTGKTASFALPIIERIKSGKGIKALILTPTRELALQITKEFESLKGKKHLKILTVYGGASINTQINALGRGVDIVVGTPGRVIDLIERKRLIITDIQYCVLDEADEMLNMGFVDDIKIILKRTPKDKKMLLFSATMPTQIKRIAEKFMNDYVTVKTKQELITDLVDQFYYNINSRDRVEGLRRIIDMTPDFYGIVFCKTRREVDELCAKLINANYSAGAIHGDVSQSEREKILAMFKKKKITILIATDVAARGIDVRDLTHVVNYSLPQSPEGYVHRIGRTGRAGKKGIAVTFVMPSERGKLKNVERISQHRLVKKDLPPISEVVKAKRINLEFKIAKIIESGKAKKYAAVAADLLTKETPVKIVAALLEHSFGQEEESYKEISKVSSSSSGNSKERRRSERSQRFGGRGRGSRDQGDRRPRGDRHSRNGGRGERNSRYQGDRRPRGEGRESRNRDGGRESSRGRNSEGRSGNTRKGGQSSESSRSNYRKHKR